MVDHVSTQTAVVATLPDGAQIAVDQLPTGELVQLIKLVDGTPDSTNAASVSPAGALKIDGSAVIQPVSVAAVPLPAGAATSANQATEISGLGALLTELQQKLEPGDSVVVSSLPAGLATGGKQDTGNTSVASIDTKTPADPAREGGNLATIAAKDFATQATLALIKAKTDNIDVLLSTRTKPADQQHVIVDSGAALTDAQLRATPVPISGSVTVSDGSGPLTVDGTVAISGTVPVSAVALPLPTGAATEATLGLASTSAKQDLALTALTTLDTDLKAEIGTVGASPGAYTVLDRLAQNTQKIDALMKTVATEVTMKKLLAVLSRPTAPAYSTLLHR